MAFEFFSIGEDGQPERHPHLYQQIGLRSLAPVTIELKGWRAGFTSSAPFWLFDEMQRCGPGNLALSYLVLTPKLTSALQFEINRLFCYHLGLGKLKKGDYLHIEINKFGERKLWGAEQSEPTSIIFCQALEPDSFATFTGKAAVCDEVTQKGFKYESWQGIQMRCATQRSQMGRDGRPMGRILAGSTVYRLGYMQGLFHEYRDTIKRKFHELPRAEFKRRYYQGTLHPKYHFIRFESTANPTFSVEEREECRRTYEPWFYDMRIRARFSKPAGVIFSGWDTKRLVDPWEIPERWPRWCLIDPGGLNFHGLIGAFDPERKRAFLYDSYHEPRLSNPERAAQILKGEWENHPRPPKWRIDQCVAGQKSEHEVRNQLAAGGLSAVEPMERDFWIGVNNLRAAINSGKLFIFKGTCEGLQDELASYAYPVDDMGKAKTDEMPEDKEKYHWIDALRYGGTHWWAGMSVGEMVVGPAPEMGKGLPGAGIGTRQLSGGVAYGHGAPASGADLVHNPAAGLGFLF